MSSVLSMGNSLDFDTKCFALRKLNPLQNRADGIFGLLGCGIRWFRAIALNSSVLVVNFMPLLIGRRPQDGMT